MSSFLRNKKLPKIWNPKEQATKLSINQIEADEIISVITNSQQFQQQSGTGVPVDMATKSYVDTQAVNVKNDILGGASGAYDTLKELQTELEGNDTAINSIVNTLSTKANQSDLLSLSSRVGDVETNKLNIVDASNTYATITNLSTTNTNLTNLTNKVNTNETTLNSHTTSISSLNSKTSALSYSGGTTTINSKLIVNLDDTLKGNTIIGDQTTDTLTINAITQLNNNLSTTGNIILSDNSNLVNRLVADETNISNISSQLTNKAEKSQIITTNQWSLNANVNTLSSVLSSIGSLTSQVINISGGTHNDTTNPNNLTAINLVMIGQDSGFSSPVSILNYGLTISGSTNTRARLSNLGINGNVIIDGTLGRHTFKSCTFNANLTFLNTTTNFINFHYCSFSGQVNIPSTFGGVIVFYFCDFSGATLSFNNVSNQQIYINSCVNLPSLSLNALLNGFNMTTSTSAINTVSLNCSGSTQFPSGSISQSSISNLSSDLSTINSSITTTNNNLTTTNNNLTTTNNNLSSLTTRVGTTETDITNLKQKTNVLAYDGSTDTLSINSKLSVVKDSSTNNGTINLGDGTGTDTINIRSNIIANSQTITPTQLGYVSGASSNLQTQITARALDNAVVKLSGNQTIGGDKTFTGTTAGITKVMVGLGNCDNTSDLNKPISTATQSALDLKANITYVDTQLANLVNSAPESLNQLNELASALGNNPNYATDMINALSLKSNDNVVVKLTGDQSIQGIKDFASIKLNGTDLNTRLSTIESTNDTQNTNITNLQSKTSAISYDSSTDTLSISSKVNISKDLTDIASIYLGDNVGNDIIYLRGNLNVLGTTNLTPTELSRLSGVSSGIQSQLNSRVTTNTSQTISGQKNFTGGLQLSGVDLSTTITDIQTKNTSQDTSITSINSSITDLQNNKQNTLTIDSVVTNGSTNPVQGGAVYTTFQNYYDRTASDNKFATITNLNSGLSAKQNILSFDSTPTSSSNNPVTSGGIFTALSSYITSSSLSSTLSSYLTSSNASSTYQSISGMSSYFGLSSNNSISGRNTFTNMNTFNRVCESVNQAGSGTNLSVDYSTLNAGIIFYAPSANFTLSLTNIPTTNTNCIYTLTLRYSAKFYANALNINGSAITMTAIGGLSNLSINSSATLVYQQIQIVFNSSSVPTATTCLMSIW